METKIFQALLISIIGGLMITAVSFSYWEVNNIKRDKEIRREIAYNFATKWHNCALAKKYVKDYDCKE